MYFIGLGKVFFKNFCLADAGKKIMGLWDYVTVGLCDCGTM